MTPIRRFLPTGLTLVRFPLAATAAYLLYAGNSRLAAAGLLAAAVLTDVLDGYCARRFDAVTTTGKTLDPLVDKASIALVGWVLVIRYGVPWWLWGAVVARDGAIILGGAFLWGRRKAVTVSNFWGKAAAAAMAAYGIIAVATPDILLRGVALGAVIVLGLASLASYAKRFWDMAVDRKTG